MLPEDEPVRQRDLTVRRRARWWGLAVLATIAALALATSLTHRPAQPTVVVTPRASQVPPTPVPSAVPAEPLVGSRFSAVEDPARRRLVVFGGVDGPDTTWLWDGRRWTLARPSLSPPGRSDAAAAYDPVTRTVMLFGGRLASGRQVNDTWAWDGAAWRLLDGGAGGPPPAQKSVMAWDESGGRMILAVNPDGAPGQTWLWSGTSWTHAPDGDPPAASSLVAMAVDPLSGSLLGISCCLAAQGATSTLAWTGTTWRQLATATQPLFGVGVTPDPTSHRLVLFADPDLVSSGETWSWDGHDWMHTASSTLPAFPEAVVTDVGAGTMVMLGSLVQPVLGNPQQPLHVWAWTGSVWSQRG